MYGIGNRMSEEERKMRVKCGEGRGEGREKRMTA